MDPAEMIPGPSRASEETAANAWQEGVVSRVGFACVFLLAFLAGLFGWMEIGGPEPFDMTPWYAKSLLCLAFAFAVARAAAPAAAGRKAQNAACIRWLAVALAAAIAMGTLSAYYHAQEPSDSGVVEGQPAV